MKVLGITGILRKSKQILTKHNAAEIIFQQQMLKQFLLYHKLHVNVNKWANVDPDSYKLRIIIVFKHKKLRKLDRMN